MICFIRCFPLEFGPGSVLLYLSKTLLMRAFESPRRTKISSLALSCLLMCFFSVLKYFLALELGLA